MPVSSGEMLTLCGYPATKQEYRRIRTMRIETVTCKRCLNLNNANIEKIEDVSYKTKDSIDNRIRIAVSKIKEIEAHLS